VTAPDDAVTWTREERLVVVRLNHPPVNALAAPVVAGLDIAAVPSRLPLDYDVLTKRE